MAAAAPRRAARPIRNAAPPRGGGPPRPHRSPHPTPGRLTYWTAAVGLAATLLVSGLPFLRFAYRAQSAHLVINTSVGLVSLLAAYLVFGRYRQTQARRDGLLSYSLFTFGLASLLLTALGGVVATGGGEHALAWSVVATRFVAAGAFAVAALLPERRARSTSGLVIVLGASATLLCIFVPFLVIAHSLVPVVVNPPDPLMSGRIHIEGHRLALVLQLVTALLYLAAAAGFTQRAHAPLRAVDPLTTWFGAGAIMLAFAHFNYVLFPSQYSDYLSTGDLLRLAAYALFTIGAAREIERYWMSSLEQAVLEDRRRIARDLHDCVGQELTYIWTEAGTPARGPADERMRRIQGAAERAIDESRRAIAALSAPAHQPLHVAVRDMGEIFARRSQLRLVFELDEDIDVTPDAREALVKILREALSNVSRHAGTPTATVRLGRDGSTVRLLVADRGRGFDVQEAATHPRGFGLTSMRERAAASGGVLRIASSANAGTSIEVGIPCTGHRPS